MKIDKAVIDETLAVFVYECVTFLGEFLGNTEADENWRLDCLAEIRGAAILAGRLRERLEEETK